MKDLLTVILAALVIAGMCCRTSGKQEYADLVLLGGSVWTVNSQQPWAEAVAVKEGNILEIGSYSSIEKMISEKTEVIDVKGAFVLPGFIDSHTHFLDGGFSLERVQLRHAESPEALIARIEEKAGELEKGSWILDGDWDHQNFVPPVLPRREWIDPVTPDNPVCVNRIDGHMVLVNSLALKLAGITKQTSSPEGGEILKDPETGEPTGILKEAAMDLVERHIPQPTRRERMKAIELAQKHANERGVTSIHEMSSLNEMDYTARLEAYQELLKAGKLTVRISVYFPISQVARLHDLGIKSPIRDDFLKIAGLKGFVDGSLGSSTALFFDPYLDDPSKKGLFAPDMFPEGIMKKRLLKADRAGYQAAVHAIGDRANNIILDLYKSVFDEVGERDRRWRIEHAQHLDPHDIERFAALGVIASVQPYHAADDGRWAEKKIGKERAKYTYAFRSLLEEGTVLAFGSDWTVAPMDPLAGIHATITRRTLDGKNPDGWIPEQKISLEDAIKGYTIHGAYAEFSETRKGSLEKGKAADLVVLSANLFDIPPAEIKRTEVLMTLVGGEVVYKKRELSGN
jgi:predicted amidohydrolase YtcJ